MRLFGKKSRGGNRCPDCRFYAMSEGYGYCAKDVPPNVNVRFLTHEGVRRQCVRCPEEMSCELWQAK